MSGLRGLDGPEQPHLEPPPMALEPRSSFKPRLGLQLWPGLPHRGCSPALLLALPSGWTVGTLCPGWAG